MAIKTEMLSLSLLKPQSATLWTYARCNYTSF